MTHCNSVNVKLFNYQLNKLTSGKKNETGVTLRSSSNMINESNDETNFPHNLLLTNEQVSKLCKVFDNNSSTDKKLSKIHLSMTVQSGGFCGRLLGPLLKTGVPLMKNLLKSLVKNFKISSISSRFRNAYKIFGLEMTILKISNKEWEIS